MRVALAALVLALLAPAASAQDAVTTAATALRSNPVFVDPAAEEAGKVDADKLRARIRDSGAAPMYVAVLGEDAGDPAAVLTALYFTYRPDVKRVEDVLDKRRVEALAAAA